MFKWKVWERYIFYIKVNCGLYRNTNDRFRFVQPVASPNLWLIVMKVLIKKLQKLLHPWLWESINFRLASCQLTSTFPDEPVPFRDFWNKQDGGCPCGLIITGTANSSTERSNYGVVRRILTSLTWYEAQRTQKWIIEPIERARSQDGKW